MVEIELVNMKPLTRDDVYRSLAVEVARDAAEHGTMAWAYRSCSTHGAGRWDGWQAWQVAGVAGAGSYVTDGESVWWVEGVGPDEAVRAVVRDDDEASLIN